jgi:hypothetical protein
LLEPLRRCGAQSHHACGHRALQCRTNESR